MSLRKTYINPLHDADTPDPFVLKHRGSYWCYCTGRAADQNCFPTLVSTDLVTWQESGGVMPPLPEHYSEYWAPEVSYWAGRFYLYFSVGDGLNMHIRVAVADSPTGPFQDSGSKLTSQEFAIDPHVFEDDDGKRWLFYATDFLHHTHIGTGTVRDLMIDPFTLAGRPSPVVRAQYDWQLFDPQRAEKGGIRWHTVEGPTVLKHKGYYYEMFSGGNWKTGSYGVGYAFSSSIKSETEWTQVCDGTNVLPVVRTIPGVIGPGHNSVVRGPDNRQMYCVYHRWNDRATRRVLAIDPLEWIGSELVVFGPTNTPQPVPNLAKSSLPSTQPETSANPNWQVISGDWSYENGIARANSERGYSEAQYPVSVEAGFLVECTAKRVSRFGEGIFGISVSNGIGKSVFAACLPDGRVRLLEYLEPDSGFDETGHATESVVIRLEASGHMLKVSSASFPADRIRVDGFPRHVGLFSNGVVAEYESFVVTRGWQDTFDDAENSLDDLAFITDSGTWKLVSMALQHQEESSAGAIFKLVPSDAYEFIANVRMEATSSGFYGFFPAATVESRGPLVVVIAQSGKWTLCLDHSALGETGHVTVLAELPRGFDVHQYQQFAFTLEGPRMSIHWRGVRLCEFAVKDRRQRIGIFATGRASFEMLRVTELVFN